MYARALLISLAVGCSFAADTAAQSRPTSGAEQPFRIQRWSDTDGLPVNSLTSIAQTRDGYLWIGTQAGLVRFDGVRFEVQRMEQLPGLGSTDISRVITDENGDLWLTSRTGAARLKEGRRPVRIPITASDLADVQDVAADPEGGVWLATGAAVIRVLGDRTQRFTVDRAENGFIRSLLPLGGGRILIGTEGRGLWTAGGNRVERVADLRSLDSADVRVIAKAPDGAIWLATRAGLLRWTVGAGLTRFDEARGVPDAWVEAISFGGRGETLIGTSGGGLLYLSDGRFHRVAAAGDADVRGILTDREGTLWIATNDQGLAALRIPPIQAITTDDGLTSAVVLPILEARDGAIWAGTFGGGVNRISGGVIESFGKRQGLRSAHILSLAEGSDGAMWIGTRDGLDRIAPSGKIDQIDLRPIVGAPILSLLADTGGVVWAGTTKGLARVTTGRVAVYSSAQGLANDYVFALARDAAGALWIGTNGGGLYRWAGKVFQAYTTEHGLPTNVITTITVGRSGQLMVGTGTGLSVMTGNKAFRTVEDVRGWWKGGINRILEDAFGDVWISTNRGLTRASAAELAASLRSGALAVVTTFTQADGMPHTETNGGMQPAGWQTRDGRLFFPTMGGIAVIDPADFRNGAAAPRPVVDEVSAAAVRLHPDSLDHIRPGTRDIAVQFTAPTSIRPEEIEFRYQLVGYDTAWVHAGTRRIAYYTNLPPGRYRFNLQSRRPTSAWSPTQTTSLRIRPWFYQTSLFAALCILTGALVLWLLHLSRIRRLRRHQEELLRVIGEKKRAERYYRSLFEDAADVVLTINREARVTALNRKGRDLLQLHGESNDGDLLRVLPTADGARLKALVAGSEPGDRGERGVTVSVSREDGREVLLELNLRPIEENGVVIGFHGIGRDLTERRRLEEQLRQAQKMEAIGRLSGGIAHDFNNLLTVIRGCAALAVEGLEACHPIAPDLNEVVRTADRAADLTKQLLTFSRKQIVQPVVLNVQAVVTELSGMLRRLLREDMELEHSFHAASALARIDRGQLEQVLTNLVLNAQDAMPHGGPITIGILEEVTERELDLDSGVLSPGNYVVISVTDSGKGIDAETRPRIFDPFFTTKGPTSGTGLGLSTVYGIVRDAGGQLAVSSRIAHGTTIRVYLPRVDDALIAPLAAESRPADQQPVSGTILLVEDEPAVRALTKRLLERAGYVVIPAATGTEALSLSEGHAGSIDLVLSDVVMPDMGGREIVERLITSRQQLKVLYMSGYTEDEILRRGIHASPGGFLEKPFTRAALLDKVKNLLG